MTRVLFILISAVLRCMCVLEDAWIELRDRWRRGRR
jgi:hypothetical protein